MSDFLEQLKLRLDEAQRRHQIAAQRLQIAQQEHMVATQDYASWQNAVRVETLREQQQQQVQQQPPGTEVVTPINALENAPTNREEISKTDLIRQMLQQHPEGLRPTDLWKQLGNQLKYRAYLYSVLKRLRDKGEVCEKRGKYFLKIVQKMETEEKTHALVQ